MINAVTSPLVSTNIRDTTSLRTGAKSASQSCHLQLDSSPLILLPPFLDSQRIQRVRKYAKTTRVYYSFPSCHYHSDARKRQRSSDDTTDSRWNNSESSEDEKEREDAALDRQEVDRVVREKGLKEKGNLQSAKDLGTHQVRQRRRRRQAASQVKINFKRRCVRVEALNICRSRGPVDPITSMPARYSNNHSRITRRLVDIHSTSPPPGLQAPTLSTPTDVNEFHTHSSHLFRTTSIPPSRINILFTRPDADHEIQEDRRLITSRSVPSPAYGLWDSRQRSYLKRGKVMYMSGRGFCVMEKYCTTYLR
ncbi:hypothetical protein NP233_g11237 [Leucocoprinus birnbaumii]|uniref:Uncharacterized protein n=1 Tax=Leucocoprinus birnbaumii TaxID=56174 RepID=A0AAD5VGT7_9AGAR|nr:hypothetical protein NP233_g11237 [Leucocoprinus birnbaumii]